MIGLFYRAKQDKTDGNYYIRIPFFPTINAYGRTEEEAVKDLDETIAFYFVVCHRTEQNRLAGKIRQNNRINNAGLKTVWIKDSQIVSALLGGVRVVR